MATITQLPEEVITIILENETISMEDIMNFKRTCKRFWQITLLCKFWEKKYYQRCPTAEKRYNKEKVLLHIDLEKRMQTGLYYFHELQFYATSEYQLSYSNVKHLIFLLRSIAEDSITYYFVLDEINRNYVQKSSKLIFNLTYEYYFEKFFNCLKQYRFLYKQIKFMNMPKTKTLFEKQLTIVMQYFAPHVSYSAVKTWLNGITQTVLSLLKIKYPSHSICSTALEQFSFWRDNNIDDNFWNETESKQIMDVLEEYIFSELEIHKLHQLLKTTDVEAKYIKYFAESFRRHLLIITYNIIARRLGVHCCLLRHKNNIEIMWKPKYNTSIRYNGEFIYLNWNSDLSYPSNVIRGLYPNTIFFSEIVNLFSPISITRFIMKDYYFHLNYHKKYCKDFRIIFMLLYRYFPKEQPINIENVYEMIIDTVEINSDKVKKSVKRRTKEVKFAVGMIVRHTWKNHFFYGHDGVIIGWRNKCDVMFLKNELKMPFSFLHRFELNYIDEPEKFSSYHYILLTENNELSYAQQDQLSICPPKKINHIEIGKYFYSFEGTHYIPNESLREEYPEDTAAITKILAKQ